VGGKTRAKSSILFLSNKHEVRWRGLLVLPDPLNPPQWVTPYSPAHVRYLNFVHYPICLVIERRYHRSMAFFRSYRRRYSRRPSSYSRRRRYGGTSSFYRSKPRRTYRRKTTRTRKSAMKSGCVCPPGELDPGSKFIIANADPFEPKGIGAKIPDSNTVPSIACALTDLVSLSLTTATNKKCWAFLPGVNSSRVESAEGAAAWTWPAAFGGTSDWTQALALQSAAELTRPVAHGIRISCAQAPTSTTGFVHLAVAYESFNNQTTWPFATTIGQLANYPWYKRVTLASLTQSPLTVINKYVDETAFRYLGSDSGSVANATPLEFHVPFGWGAILIAVEGGSATNALQLESILHIEGIPKQSSVIQGTTAAAYSPGIMKATARMVSQSEFSHTEQNQAEYFGSSIAAAIGSGVSSAGNVALENILKPMAMKAGYNLAGHAISYGLAGLASLGVMGVNSNPERLSLTR